MSLINRVSRDSTPVSKPAVVPVIPVVVSDKDMELQRDSFYEKALYDQQARVLTPEQLSVARAAIGRK